MGTGADHSAKFKTRPEVVEFVFRVRSPSITYAVVRMAKGEREEGGSFYFQAYCVAPDRFAGRDASVRIIPASGLGSIFADKTAIDAVIHMPAVACWGIVGAVGRGEVSMVSVQC